VSLPGSFGAVQNLKGYGGESYIDTVRYLSKQDAYTLYKQRRIRFPRRNTYSKGIGDLYQADLVDITNISHYNDVTRYLLTCIDVFSKKRLGHTVTFEDGSSRDRSIRKNHRLLWQGQRIRQLFHFCISENEDIKAAVVERFNKTLKTKMYCYFTFKNTWRYIDILQDLVDSYNATRHRSISMSPDEVTVANEDMVHSGLNLIESIAKKPRYVSGDTVRITVGRRLFAK